MNIGVTGKNGEDRVAAFLRKQGCNIIKRNHQCRFGEIDIIAESGEYILFVEVKTRKENSMVSPAESVTPQKQQRLILTAEDYISKTGCELQPRFDVAEVTVRRNQKGEEKYSLNYIKNAF